jgi:hypothetical protein
LSAPELPQALMRGDFDPMMFMRVAHVFGLIGLLSIIVLCMVTVGIQNKALGKHPGPVFFYFSLGAPVWRLLGTWFLAWLVVIVVIALTVGAAIAIWFAAGSYVPQFATPIRVVATVAAVFWVIYMMVRLTFFIPAVVVAEERIGLGRAWELAGGNFWRIVIVAIAVLLPVAIGFGIVSNALFGSMIDLSAFHQGMDVHEMIRAIFHQMRVIGPVAIVYSIIERIVFLGLGNGMIADAYLGVTGTRPAA